MRIDGSVDRTQEDKIYVGGRLITKTGTTELIFMGIDEQVERGAIGLFHAVMGAMNNMFTKDFVDECILPKVSSICTDGVVTNRGDKGGLWYYLDDIISKSKSNIPLVKIWCVAHRANLTFGDLTNKNPTISSMISTMSSISSYFHQSGLRTAALKKKMD